MSRPVRIFDAESNSHPMRVACFMSGSGTNVERILEHQLSATKATYNVVLIFTDVKDEKCSAKRIAENFGIPLMIHDIEEFYAERGHPSKSDLTLRPEFDRESAEMIKQYDIDLVALGGYMSILTAPMVNSYPGAIINVHPADLSIREKMKRKYTGLHSVQDAILAGESEIYSTTHVVREQVDYGEILMRSKPVHVKLPPGVTPQEMRKIENRKLLDQVVHQHQQELKERGDWVIFPRTLDLIGEGHLALDGEGHVYLDGEFLPNGVRC